MLPFVILFSILQLSSTLINACELPVQWSGLWYQSKDVDVLSINRTHFMNKGVCIDNVQDKYLIYDKKEFCYRCVFAMQKHYNVLQYRASYCTEQNDFNYNCQNLTPESELVTIYRENGIAEKCPLHDMYQFVQTQNDMDNAQNKCAEQKQQSNIMQCADQTMLKLEFNKCTTTLPTFTINCIAHWTEGNTNYLIGRLNSPSSNQQRANYRCLVYTETNTQASSAAAAAPAQSSAGLNRNIRYNHKHDEDFIELPSSSQSTQSTLNTIQLSVSQDEFCRNFIADNIADEQFSFTFSKAALLVLPQRRNSNYYSRNTNSTSNKTSTVNNNNSNQHRTLCRFPKWFNKHWNNVKGTKLFMLDQKYETILILDEKNSLVSSKLTCAQVKHKKTNSFQAIIRTLNGCNNGYQCMTITSRSEFVVEVKLGRFSTSLLSVDCNEHISNEILYVDTSIGVQCPFKDNVYEKNQENPNFNKLPQQQNSGCKYVQSQILQIGCQSEQQYSLRTKLCYTSPLLLNNNDKQLQSTNAYFTQLESEINLICLAHWRFDDYIVIMSKSMTNEIICSVWSLTKDDKLLKFYDIDANCNYFKKSTFKLTYEFTKIHKCNEQTLAYMTISSKASSSTKTFIKFKFNLLLFKYLMFSLFFIFFIFKLNNR